MTLTGQHFFKVEPTKPLLFDFEIYAHNKKTSRQQGGQPANQAARQYHKASAESLSSSTRGIYAIFLKVGEVDALHCPIAPAGGRCCAATVLS